MAQPLSSLACRDLLRGKDAAILWRGETYCGVKMQQIGFLEFWEFMWRERSNLWRFLKWTAEIERYVHPGLKRS